MNPSSLSGGLAGGDRNRFCGRVDVGSKFMARDAGKALDLQDAFGWNSDPLLDGRTGHTKAPSEFCGAAGRLNGPLFWAQGLRVGSRFGNLVHG